jgi:hypothetical protein
MQVKIPPFSTCEETSTQNPCVFELCKLIIFARKNTIAAPQKTEMKIQIYFARR